MKQKVYILFILLLVILGTASITVYYNFKYKNIDNIQEDKKNSSDDSNSNEKQNYNENNNGNIIIEDKEYKLLVDEDRTYLVKKDGINYKIIYDLGSDVHYIGFYNNKIYYSNENIMYIDLSNEDFTANIWIKIPQLYDEFDEIITISNSKIAGNKMYFNFYTGGLLDTDGILVLDMTATQFEDYKKISILSGNWFVDENGENIYFMNFYRDDNTVYKYNTLTSNTEKLFNTTSYSDGIKYIPNNIIYYNDKKDELSLFNVNTKKSTILSTNLHDVTWSNGGTLMWGIVSIVGSNLYYYNIDGTIMKYDSITENITKYYKIEDTYYYRGYNFYDDNNFKITYDCYKHVGFTQQEVDPTCTKTKDFVSNNKIVEQFPLINVTMLDGSIKSFTIENFILP